METKPFVFDDRRDSCDCSQQIEKLSVTGYSNEQGPVKYCPVCRIGFWEHLIQPTPLQVTLAQKTDSRYNMQNMQYYVLKRKPKNKWGSTPESTMVDQLGKCPTWMSEESKAYWLKEYCKKYPFSPIALNVKSREPEDYDK